MAGQKQTDTSLPTLDEFYFHADFPGNPRKNGIINITEAPDLPINQRKQCRPKKT